MVTILIDTDGCQVVDLMVRIRRVYSVLVKILCDTARRIEREGTETLVFGKCADGVNVVLVNWGRQGDIVIHQDYGLAGICLARRHENKKLLRAGNHPNGPAERMGEQDGAFTRELKGSY